MRREVLDTLVCPRSGQALAVEPLEDDGGEVEYAILSSEAGRYPVVGGIPIFLGGHEQVTELVASGRHREAAALAAFGEVPHSRLGRLAACLEATRPTRRLGEMVAGMWRLREAAAGAAVLFDRSGPSSALEVIRYAYLDALSPNVDAFNYFAYRYGLPRHLVALSFIEAASPGDGAILDLGCGAGHLTWSLRTRFPDHRVTGVDRSFFQLWVARNHVAAGADLVCADAAALPFPAATFGLVLASDVMSFVTEKWAAVREAERVLSQPGTLMLTSVKNSLCRHVYAGEPLSPDGWAGLVGDLPHRLVPDGPVLDRYLAGAGAPAPDDAGGSSLDASPTLSVLAFKGGAELGRVESFEEWPHARGDLGVNPLFRVASVSGDRITYERSFPSPSYAADNPALLEYLPERLTLSLGSIEAAGRGERPEEVEAAVRSVAVLGFPPGYVEDPWGTADQPAGGL